MKGPQNASLRIAKKILYSSRAARVPITVLRCIDLPFTREQGFGGCPVNAFPPTSFFKRELEAEGLGRREFEQWYWHWFVERRGWKIPKSEGGMRGGSLHQCVLQLLESAGVGAGSPDDADQDLLKHAISSRVQHYLGVLRSLREHGFVQNAGSRIRCATRGAHIEILNGHHRIAALSVLGHGSVTVSVVNYRRIPWRQRLPEAP